MRQQGPATTPLEGVQQAETSLDANPSFAERTRLWPGTRLSTPQLTPAAPPWCLVTFSEMHSLDTPRESWYSCPALTRVGRG